MGNIQLGGNIIEMSKNFRPITQSEQVTFEKELKEVLAKYAMAGARRARFVKMASAVAKMKGKSFNKDEAEKKEANC